MWDWWSSRPQRCLKFGTDSLAWAESEQSWHGRRRRKCVMSPLPNGMISPSPMELNVSDVPALADRVRTVTNAEGAYRVPAGATRSAFPRPITVLLPDTAVRATVLHFGQLPARPEERESLIRWRLGQEQLLPLNGARMVFQVFQGQEADGSAAYTALTVSIQESVLQQYESLCESLGLIPYDVGITSLRLLDLWTRVTNGSEGRRRNVLWVNVADRSLTTIVCRRARPLFYRCKLLGEDVSDALSDPDVLNRVLEECGASLEVCRQRHPSLTIEHAVICAEGEVVALQEHIERELRLSVERLDWKAVETLGWVANGTSRGMASLAALAGLP